MARLPDARQMEAGEADSPIVELLTTYNELNPSCIEELDEEPSPLEFMRYVARNTPFVVRRGAWDWTATQTWDAAYLRSTLAGNKVNVAVTPFGNADAPTLDDKGCTVFAKPHEEDQEFSQFLEYVMRQEQEQRNSLDGEQNTRKGEKGEEVRYAQTQNDNLRHEYVALFSQVEKSIAFARIALERDPEAINMWIGNSHSVTALHRDNYENIYVQIAGRKHFVLLPPLFQPCVNEQELEPATYVRGQSFEMGEEEHLVLRMDAAEEQNGAAAPKVPFATWDPDIPEANATPYSHLAEPVRVSLEPGDMLYLPAMWYHKVSQSCSEDGICVAVNYWHT